MARVIVDVIQALFAAILAVLSRLWEPSDEMVELAHMLEDMWVSS